MPSREIINYPHPTLRKVAKPLAAVDDEVRTTVDAMAKLMREAKGVGLAAPQVDWSVRLFVVETEHEPSNLAVYVNPEILDRQGKVTAEEGCLSLPEIRGKVERATTVRVRYRTLDGQEVVEDAKGLRARAIQHEYDHLEGILILSRMSPAERKLNAAQVKELEERFREAQAS